jgi:hypothetical protein
MSQGEVFFLKMNNGDDLLVQMLGDEEDCLWVTQPYLVELLPSVESMTVTTSIMRWIPFESLMEEKVRINKINILTYLMVDDIIANKYLNTISEHSREQTIKARERQKELFRQYVAIANTTGSFH